MTRGSTEPDTGAVKPRQQSSTNQLNGNPILRRAIFRVSNFLVLGLTAAIARFVLVPDRGIDLTDEGLYLAALYGPQTHSWGFPYAWHLQPISNLVGENIVDLRFIFSWIVLLVFYLFGYSTGVFLRYRLKNNQLLALRYQPFITGVVSVVFGLTFFDLLLNRLPSYNWVNMVGLVVAISGLFLLLALEDEELMVRTSIVRLSLVFLVAFGAFYSLPGKPSSILFIAIAVIFGSWLFYGRRRALVNSLLFAGFISLIGFSFVFLGAWPKNFADIIVPAFSLVDLNPGSSVLSSLAFELTYVSVIYEEASLVSAFAFPLLAFGYLSLLALIGLGNTKTITATFLAATVLQILINGPLRNALFDEGLLEAGVPNSLTAWIYFSMATALMVRMFIKDEYNVRKNWKVLLFTYFIFAGGIFSYGFGSGMGVFGKTSDGAVFLFLATLVVLLFLSADKFGKTLTSITASGLVLASLFSLSASILDPYRAQSTMAQTERVSLVRGGDILLDPQRSEEVQVFMDMIAQVRRTGDETVIPLMWRWSSTLPVVSGLPSYPTLMPTIFGYEGSLGVLEKTLGRSWELGFGGAGDYYLITDQFADLESEQVEIIEKAISLTVSSIEQNAGKESSIKLIEFAPYSIWKVTLD